MNLARVEYHFSDPLSVLESGRDDQGWTQEGIEADESLISPPNLNDVREIVLRWADVGHTA